QVVFLCDCDKLLLVDGRVVLVLKTLNLRLEPFLRLALELFGTVCLLLNAVSLLLYLLADGIGYVCVVLLVLRQSSAEPLGNVVLGKLIQLVFALFNLFGQILNLRQSLFKFLVLVLIALNQLLEARVLVERHGLLLAILLGLVILFLIFVHLLIFLVFVLILFAS